MAQQSVLLRAQKWGKLFAGLALLTLIWISILEIRHPGTISSIMSGAWRWGAALIDAFDALIDSLVELKRAISNWL